MIRILGAREHNLRNVSVDIPRDRLTVITGLSGSGKSSLAFDTLYAEGQRRYIESLSASARQFLDQLRRPDVDAVEGLSPAIAIGQRTLAGANPRSIVATATELMDFLRVLYSIAGVPHCPKCGRTVGSTSAEQMVETLLELPERTRLTLLAPLVRNVLGDTAPHIAAARAAGFVRIRIDGVLYDLDAVPALDPAAPHTIEVVVDRLVVKEGVRSRLADSVELTLRHGNGLLTALLQPPATAEGLPSPPSGGAGALPRPLQAAGPLHFSERNYCPDCDLDFDRLDAASFSFNSPRGACHACTGLGRAPDGAPCPECHGLRLRPESRACLLPNPAGSPAPITDLLASTISAAQAFFQSYLAAPDLLPPVARVAREILDRLTFLDRVGVGYLTLDRECATLSGGEAQRIRLATQIGSSLSGVLYVLDEPSIGLHPRDTARLLDTLRDLRDRGNTVVVVEHDPDIIRAADHIIEMGPGAGRLGGSVLYAGPLNGLLRCPASVTAPYLAKGPASPSLPPKSLAGGRSAGPSPKSLAPKRPAGGRSAAPHPTLLLRDAHAHNLRHIDVAIPLHRLVAITGVSGSGKSTLVHDELIPAVQAQFGRRAVIDKLVLVDQSPIGRTPRSNPATYTGLFDDIRALFAQTPTARARGYGPARFSFNAKGGRCEVCKGDGVLSLEMSFLPDATIPCPQCAGRRYNRETLEVRYAGRTIADVLSMTVDEALGVFAPFPRIRRALEALRDVGLGYIQLGQPAATLSGGEAQRVKLAAELQRPAERHTLYVLDEPTSGLHFADVERLLDILLRLRDNGHTIVVVEHNLDVIRAADWVIDLGPEGGDEGGLVVAAGPPDAIAACPASHTGAALRALSGHLP